MRRPTDLAVDTDISAMTSTTTPDASTLDIVKVAQSTTTIDIPSPAQSTHPSALTPAAPQPSYRLLFSLVSRRDFYVLVLPAILTSMLAGGVAPFMTYVIGQNFDAFAAFPLSNATSADKHTLLHGVGMAALELVGLAVAALALSSITSSLWIWTGERNLRAVRKQVYDAVTTKDMVWFDTKMGADDSVQTTQDDGPIGAGGLMAKFARETDDVRMASSLAAGMTIQYLTTTVTCLILAFTRSWSLTLVILSTVPVLMFIQGLSQALAGPKVGLERSQTAAAATLVDRVVAAISTVKAFNAEGHEQLTFGKALDNIASATFKLNTVWGVTSAFSQFVMMAMFVQGFWYGAQLVRDGKNSAGDVMSVFWACLICTSNLQMCIPQFIILAKGKFSMASLVSLIESTTASPGSTYTPVTSKLARRPTQLRRIIPMGCRGEFELDGVNFAYPSRPDTMVLQDINLFLPSHEMSFIVGGSGSGKSTIAQLLMRMYEPSTGEIRMDDQDMTFLDRDWVRKHVATVSQTCILFDMSVHDNVAIGMAYPGSRRAPAEMTREEIESACTAALMHEFVRDLPDGYDTMLGTGGANLSGGQKQRLAIARALLRNPTVLILDEATSALDATSRILVFEAIKRWRQNMTTIIITHDLSQISDDDFVHVLKDGRLVEQGFRAELESFADSEFAQMADTQAGGFPEKAEDESSSQLDGVNAILERQDEEKQAELATVKVSTKTLKHASVLPPLKTPRPLTMGNWMLDAIAELTKPATVPTPVVAPSHVSRSVPGNAFTAEEDEKDYKQQWRQTLHIDIPSIAVPPASVTASHRYSLQFTPTSPTLTYHRSTASLISLPYSDDEYYEFDEKKRRLGRAPSSDMLKAKRIRRDEFPLTSVVVKPAEDAKEEVVTQAEISFWRLVRDIYPTVPRKPLIVFGLLICIASGAMTPLFSYLLSRLMYEVSIGAQHVSLINIYGGIVLAVAGADGLFIGLKYFVMESAAMSWVTRIRKQCFARVLAQDKTWFDKTDNSPVRLTQILIKDGDDARQLIATVLAQVTVVIAMLGIGLIWALVEGWQLTLVGVAIAPVFGFTMAVQTNLVAKCETRNKRARETVAKGYYEAILNVRGIRAMGLESAFKGKFDTAVDQAQVTGIRGAFVEGCTYGVSSALIYLSEALLFYVGAVLIAQGTYDYLRMVQVLNLVVFSVSIGSQLMAFTQRIAKAVRATRDFNELLQLPTDSVESRGILRPEMQGPIEFDHVDFAYPERPDVPVLKDLSLSIENGECVAIVGSSGCGKSTIAALLQRLYEPSSGNITVGTHELRSTDVHHLRDHVAVVSQQPNLFDASITENIAYGNAALTDADVRRAAQAAHVHDFVESLPRGYDTPVGENAALISGGQAQRLQIARALARPADILILDECTSALDSANQAAVMATLREAKVGRTTVVVTHKLQMMRMCDRILVVRDGAIVEEGSYESLMGRHGVFAQLASGGEWSRE